MRYHELRAEDVMSTALVTATLDETIEAADFDMKLAEIHHIPVLDDKNRLAGVVSNRDVLRTLTKARGRSVQVKKIMTTDVKTVSADVPASAAAEILLSEKIGCLPVLGSEGQLVGIVTATDFLRIAYRVLLGESDARNVL